MNGRLLLSVHAGATLFMVGLIWFVQIVHYPLFREVARLAGDTSFARYEALHSQRTTLVVAPMMLLELATAILLLFARPAGAPGWVLVAGVGLVGVIWLSTAFLQVPRHAELAAGFQAQSHAALVVTNWLRTVAWTLRGVLALWLLAGTELPSVPAPR